MIDAAGEQVGIVSLQIALEKARAAEDGTGMDLVEISPNSKPPVCRIMDYGKYYFQDAVTAQWYELDLTCSMNHR